MDMAPASRNQHAASSARFEHRLWGKLGIALLCVALSAAWALRETLDQRRAASREQAIRTAAALALTVGETLKVAQAAMLGVSADLAATLEAGHDDPRTIGALLQKYGKAMPEYLAVVFIDARGVGIGASVPEFRSGASYADRDYFRRLIEQPGLDHFFGEPLQGRTLGKQFFPISRRVLGRDGRLLGVLMGSFEPVYFARLFEPFQQGSEGAISLVNTDVKKIVARWPNHARHFAQDIAGDELARRMANDAAGAFENTTLTDGVNRLVAFQRVEGQPLLVAVGLGLDELDAATATTRRYYAIGGVALGLLIIAVALALQRSHRQALAQLRTDEQLGLAQRVIAASSEAIVITDADNLIVSVNPAFERITGYAAAEVIGKNPGVLKSGHHDTAFYRDMWAAIEQRGCWEGEIMDRRRNGLIYPKWLTITAVRDQPGERPSNYLGIFSDITERKVAENRIRQLAYSDPLTGLPNRNSLFQTLDHAMALARRGGDRLALIFIDLDHFKVVNDTLGHHAGDRLLVEVARRLTGSVRSSDTVARIGGDEFVILVEGEVHTEGLAGLAQKIIVALGEPIDIDGRALHATPSLGIACFPDDGEDRETLMRHADTAMYSAKAGGRNAFRFFASEMNAAALQRMDLEAALRTALEKDEFELYYQPKIHVGDGAVGGLEALIRWHRPGLGMVPPAAFIPVAEESGLIFPIGAWVLREGCRQARRWHDAGFEFGHVAINISAHQFRAPDFVSEVAAILRDTGVPPSRIELEITESVAMATADATTEVLRDLKALGLSLSIDDFGTGYSSLAYLKRFPVDRLKIDRSFVVDLETDPNDAAIVDSVIAMSHALRLQLVAEGVETPGQIDYLRERRCDWIQGYVYHRPMPASEVAGALGWPSR